MKIQLQMSSDILQCWISSEVEFTSVMTDFPSSAIQRICGALNRLVSDVIINWHVQHARPKMSLISSALPNVLLVMVCCWVVGIVKTLKNDAMEHEEITNIEIYWLKFILKLHVFVLHVTSFNTGSVQLCTVQLVLELCTVLALT